MPRKASIELTNVEALILFFLVEKPKHAYEIDKESKESSSSTDEIIGHLKHEFVEKMGKDVDINTRLINKIEGKGPRIVSKVNRENININGYI